ncbi:4509_t:CDS:2, partial [Diversispora eburnea]
NVIIQKANEIIPKKKKLISGKYEESKKKIEKIREDYNIEIAIPIWTEISDENKNWLKEVKKMHYTLHKIFEAEIKEANYKKIKEQIVKRNKNFLNNKKIVIQSLLNKERPRIVTDKDLNQYQEWKQTYNQNNEIQEEWFLSLTKSFTAEEIEGLIRKLPNKKTPAKPKDWKKNIWTITLLETVRKIFTKGIYNRL